MTMTSPPLPHDLVASRLLVSPRLSVFNAFTDPALLTRWWGPAGFTSTFQQFEPRPGGAWRLVLHGPDGADYPLQQFFQEIGPGRIVVRHQQEGHDFTLDISLTPEPGGTRVTWRMRFDSPEEAERVRQYVVPANEQNLDRLQALLAEKGPAGLRPAVGCPVLETTRLALREMTGADLDFMAEILADPEVMRHYPSLQDRAGAANWIDRQVQRYERDGTGLWLVAERGSGQAVGQIGLLVQDVEGVMEPEIGYMLNRPFWGQGFATEAAAAIRDFAFHRLACPSVISLISPANHPSQAVARRVGMIAEREVSFHGLPHLVFRVHRPLPSPADSSGE